MYLHLVFVILLLSACPVQESYRDARESMVRDQIERRGVNDQNVLKAMRQVERHKFVPEEYRSRAYYDGALPIGQGQTISQPYIVAYMTEIIEPEKDDKVLEIGTGSGYQAAVLAEIVKEVYSIELLEPLHLRARGILESEGYDNVKLKHGDGFYGWEEYAPYDAIVVTAAIEEVPQPLIDQLKDGGKLIIPVGGQRELQYLELFEKKNEKLRRKKLFPVRFVPFKHED